MKVGIVWRSDPLAGKTSNSRNERLEPVFRALAENGASAEAVVYSEEDDIAVRKQVSGLDGLLVWVNPIDFGRDRSQLDALLRDAAASGVWVSAHPDVILRMGTKDVLYETRGLGWGTETLLYPGFEDLLSQFPRVLMSSPVPRVLKQYRGTGGIGVWKVELVGGPRDPAAATPDVLVRVQEAQRGRVAEEIHLGDFFQRSEEYFRGDGHLIDQPFQERLGEGLIRCYLCQDRVIAFAHQAIVGLSPQPTDHLPASAPAYHQLRRMMEDEWLPGLMEVLHLSSGSLPVLWDADFLLGTKLEAAVEKYVLCEINVSCVTPLPEFAAGQIARAAVQNIRASKR